MMRRSQLIIGLLGLKTMILSGCAPVAIVGGATWIGKSAVQEKGFSGAFNDSQISNKIRLALYKEDPNIWHHVNVTVHHGEVMLTGDMPSLEMKEKALKVTQSVIQSFKASRSPLRVQRVIDNMSLKKGIHVGESVSDAWITSKIKGNLLWAAHIQSLNYKVKTLSGIVHVMGIAQDQQELDRVLTLIRNTDGVIKVVSYVTLKGECLDFPEE